MPGKLIHTRFDSRRVRRPQQGRRWLQHKRELPLKIGKLSMAPTMTKYQQLLKEKQNGQREAA